MDMDRKNDHFSCMMNFAGTSQHSSIGSLSKISAPIGYQRKKQCTDCDVLFRFEGSEKSHPCSNSLSIISSEAPSLATEKHLQKFDTEASKSPVSIPIKCTRESLHSKWVSSGSGCCVGKELGCVEDSKHDMVRNDCGFLVNDSCSSSKSNIDLRVATLKTAVEDTGEGSSSEAFAKVSMSPASPEKDVNVVILKSLGLHEGVWPVRTSALPESNSECNCFQSCKVCDQLELTVNMLICDQCEEAFHISCCYPRLRELPINEWFCHPCMKEKHKMSKELNARRQTESSGKMGRGSSKDSLAPIVAMLKDTEDYTTSVRIGPEYQAEVPDWCGPLASEVEDLNEPLEMSFSETFQEGYSSKPYKVSSICNWLQCQAVINGIGENVDGTVCGKWRRAPLFEVQTDKFDCFHSFLWDPAHADCAVPQEVDTDKVLKDLKYIEMLRPRLDAKRRKMGRRS